MSHKKTLAIFFGGRSSEHEISIISALQCIKSIDPELFNTLPVYIDPAGTWWTGEALLDKTIYKSFSSFKNKLQQVRLPAEPTGRGLSLVDSPSFFASKERFLKFDVAIPVFHGQFGEDGCMQGLFELAGVPYAGSPVAGSAVAMNKYLCKQVALGIGVPTLPSVLVRKSDFQRSTANVVQSITNASLPYPLFVKPNNLGSSVGVGSAENETKLLERISSVLTIDSEVIVEPMLQQMLELNVSVAADRSAFAEVGYGARPSVIEMPVASKQILTYEDKYLRGGKGAKGSKGSQGMASLTRVIDPQDIEQSVKDTVTRYALRLFDTLGCSGVGRFDFMLDTATGSIYFNELNPIPGSLSFYLWEKSSPKVLYPDLINRMVDEALARFAIKATLKRDVEFKAL
jgi:D-alanine-D-alanine ligase